jgi:hypothetical protein
MTLRKPAVSQYRGIFGRLLVGSKIPRSLKSQNFVEPGTSLKKSCDTDIA